VAALDEITRATSCAQVADHINPHVLAQHPERDALRGKWRKSKERWTARAGWHLTANCVNKGAEGLDTVVLLDRIDRELAKASPEVQWTMNNTLMAIGVHQAAQRQCSIAIGERIGLYRDWPVSKGCIIPYVPVCVPALVKRLP